MKIQGIILLCLISSTLSNCSVEGCVSCYRSGGRSECLRCYKRYVVSDSCSSELAPESEHCLLYANGFPGCLTCEEGYARDDDNDSSCVQSKGIENCVQSKIKNGVEACTVCKNGYPGEEGQSCIPYPEGQDRNCLLGYRQYDCYKCKPGTVANQFSNCVSDSGWESCLKLTTNPRAFDREECALCNFYDGFTGYPNLNGCRKMNSFVKF